MPMSKFFAALALVAACIFITPSPASAAVKSDGVRNAGQYEVSSRRYYRRVVVVRPIYRPWRPYWGWHRAYWGPAYGYYRPWRPYYRPWGWGYRPWGYAAYRPWGWGWGWGPRWGVGFYW